MVLERDINHILMHMMMQYIAINNLKNNKKKSFYRNDF